MSTKKSLKWSFATEAGQFLLQFAASVIIARLLTPDELGVFALAMAANALLYILRDFGIGAYLIREQEVTHEKVRTAFGMWILLSWPAGFGMLLSRDYIAAAVGSPDSSGVIALLAITFFITPFGQPIHSILARNMRFDVIHHVSLVSTFIGTALSIMLAYAGFSYMAMAWGVLVTSITRIIHLYIYQPEHLRLRPSLMHWREVLQFGGYLTGASIASTASSEGTKFILGNLLGPASVALVDKASQMPNMLRQGLLNPVARVLVPALSQQIRDGQKVDDTVERLLQYFNCLLWPAFLALSLVSTPLVVFIFGENWRQAGELLPYFILSQAIPLALPHAYHLLQPFGAVKRIFIMSVITASTGLALAIYGALNGIELFSRLLVLQAIITTIVNYACIRDYWKPPLRILRYHAHSLVISVFSCIPLYCFLYFSTTEPSGFNSIAALLAFPPSWLLSVYITKHPLSKEINSLFRKYKS